MSYMQDLEARLKVLLSGMPEGEQAIIISELKKIVLESYRNGQAAGPKPQRESRKPAPAKQ
jgi:hypothetical protein